MEDHITREALKLGVQQVSIPFFGSGRVYMTVAYSSGCELNGSQGAHTSRNGRFFNTFVLIESETSRYNLEKAVSG
jgi:hypothetical protein